MIKYKIKTTIFPNGERLPLLIDQNGIPDYWSTIYVTTQLRARNRAAGTIQQSLKNIMVLKSILDKYYINENILIQRFEEGRVLSVFEIEGITEECKFHLDDIKNNNTSTIPPKLSIKSLEKMRATEDKKNLIRIDSKTTGNRIRTIKDFLIWFTNVHISKLGINHPNYINLTREKELMISIFNSRIPRNSKSSIGEKEGISKQEMNTLFSIINRNSKNNIWKSEFVKIRNELIVIWLVKFGLRRSELLNIKVSDINFKKEEFHVLRRADDPDDPRVNKPNVKTKGRKISVPLKIIELTYSYITEHRAILPNSKTHEYLFVSDKTGDPLSSISINKIFEKLRDANTELPKNLSAHSMRHSWNDSFSELMDKNDIGEAREQQMRNYLMGWSNNSRTAGNYTRRHIRTKANEVLLELGNTLLKDIGKEK